MVHLAAWPPGLAGRRARRGCACCGRGWGWAPPAGARGPGLSGGRGDPGPGRPHSRYHHRGGGGGAAPPSGTWPTATSLTNVEWYKTKRERVVQNNIHCYTGSGYGINGCNGLTIKFDQNKKSEKGAHVVYVLDHLVRTKLNILRVTSVW